MKTSLACVFVPLLFGVPTQATKLISNTPVEKVVTLLSNLKQRLDADEKKEQQVFDKYACWCEKTTARKAGTIETARESLRSLGQMILSSKGKAATLAAELKQLLADIQANEESQAEATSIRSKENGAYQAESAEMQQAVAALEKAILVLKAGSTSESFLQHSTEIGKKLRTVIASLPLRAASAVAQSKIAMIVRSASSQSQAGGIAYAPQSATIQGILADMYNTFAKDLQSATQTEAQSQRDFEALIAAKQDLLAKMQESVQKKEAEKAETEVMLADSMQSYDNTEGQLKADIQFFDTTKEACTAKASDWTTRSGMRAEELQGITAALDLLTSDSARELFAKAIKPGVATSFFQASTAKLSGAGISHHAFDILKRTATSSHSVRLAMLAARMGMAKVGHFDEVLKAIDTMIGQLKSEETDDIAKRDQCKDEYQQINRTIADTDWKIAVAEAKIAKLQSRIESMQKEKAQTIVEIGDVEQQITDMKQERQDENAAFLQAKTEDEEAITLLTQAKEALMVFYTKNNITLGPLEGHALLQKGPEFAVSEDQAPEAVFSEGGARKGESKGIISLLSMIIEDLGGEIRVGQQSEEKAQLAFEKALNAATKVKGELEDKKDNLETMIADRQEEEINENTALQNHESNKTETLTYEEDIKPDCDWILGAFGKRRVRREAEMAGLVQAKEFLAGYQANSE
eukprot:TRINITY_DN69306_c0_g1_i1.p1 TRINITY_DN69306_c0_g1~~TRINITY_DN69306_c0_g1_i1.p1  ORF type:complete len:693 (+),score=168.86 TRINITY_DN69306_c0_g1_i1:57-2135(+)